MRDAGVAINAVVGDHEELIGVITDRDIAIVVVSHRPRGGVARTAG